MGQTIQVRKKHSPYVTKRLGALLRLTWARLDPEPITGPRCLWAEIATGPRPIEDVIGVSRARASAPTRVLGSGNDALGEVSGHRAR
jgi:hypothetical protein